ncbi:MAG: recombinase family protein, partial [Armatimonadota bacterium]
MRTANPSARATAQNKRPLRYAMLLRCSSDDQALGDFTTIDSQRQINRRFIEERIAESGGTFTGEYIGEGKSGKDLKRPDWIAAYADARARKFDVLVISYMSRLARGSVYHAAEYLLHQEGVRVVMVKENFGSDTAGRILKDITILGDGLYIQKVSEHTKAKQSEMMEKGYICGGHRLFGFNHEIAPGMADMVLPGGKTKPAPKVRVP